MRLYIFISHCIIYGDRDLFWFVQARPRPYFFGAGIVGAYFLLAQQNFGTEFSTLEKIWSRSIFDIQTRPRAPWGGGGAARARAREKINGFFGENVFLEKNEKNAIFSEKKNSAQKRRTELYMGTRPKIRSSLRSSVTRLFIRISDGNFAFVSPHI